MPGEFPDPVFTLAAVVRDLEARKPRYLIFETLHATSDPKVARAVDALPEQPMIRRLLTAYDLDTRIEDFTLYRLR